MLLESTLSCKVAGEAADGRAAIELIEQTHPDVLVIDMRMPEMNGLEVIRHVRVVGPQTRIVVLSMYDGERYVREAAAICQQRQDARAAAVGAARVPAADNSGAGLDERMAWVAVAFGLHEAGRLIRHTGCRLFEILPAGVAIVDDQQTITQMNPDLGGHLAIVELRELRRLY